MNIDILYMKTHIPKSMSVISNYFTVINTTLQEQKKNNHLFVVGSD